MNLIEFEPKLEALKCEEDVQILKDVVKERAEIAKLYAEENYKKALDHATDVITRLRGFSDYANLEFRAAVVSVLFDFAELHFALKDYKQSKKELEVIFKLLDGMVKEAADRFAPHHVLAMELSTRILRSRKKTLELLAKQQLHTGQLYEKVNSGVAAATDKLVESLRKGAEMLASTGDYNGAVKFYMEAIKLSKKRTGRVTRREIAMTIEMARLMMHSKSQTDRAKRLLNAVLPHAVALEILELEQEIHSLLKNIEENVKHESSWKTFLDKLQKASRFVRKRREDEEEKEASAEESKEGKKK